MRLKITLFLDDGRDFNSDVLFQQGQVDQVMEEATQSIKRLLKRVPK